MSADVHGWGGDGHSVVRVCRDGLLARHTRSTRYEMDWDRPALSEASRWCNPLLLGGSRRSDRLIPVVFYGLRP